MSEFYTYVEFILPKFFTILYILNLEVNLSIQICTYDVSLPETYFFNIFDWIIKYFQRFWTATQNINQVLRHVLFFWDFQCRLDQIAKLKKLFINTWTKRYIILANLSIQIRVYFTYIYKNGRAKLPLSANWHCRSTRVKLRIK
jgi:hypothetical protein